MAVPEQQVSLAVKDAAQSLGVPLIRFFVAWTARVLPWLALVCFLAITYDYFSKYRDRPIQFLLGPRGGDGANQALHLKQEFKEKSFLGPNYLVSTTNTNGYLDIYRQISVDRDGTLVGFTMDGYEEGPSDNVRTILPLDWEYLHFVLLPDPPLLPNSEQSKQQTRPANKAVASAASAQTETGAGPGPKSLIEWAATLNSTRGVASSGSSTPSRKPRIYLGPVDSGTRLVAQAVLRRVGIDPKDVEAVGIADFQEMLVKLHQREIQGAFYLGPYGSNAIEEACKGEDCHLVSIDPKIVNSLVSAYPFLQESELPAHLYSSAKNGDARQGDLFTLATRRVLVASTAMPAVDAYHIAQHVQDVFSRHVAFPLGSEQKFAGPNLKSTATTLRYKPHLGAMLDPMRPAPPSWLDRNTFWIAPLLLAVVLSVLNEMKPSIAKWLESHRPGIGKSPSESNTSSPKTIVTTEEQSHALNEAPVVSESPNVEVRIAGVETNGQAHLDTVRAADLADKLHGEGAAIALEIKSLLNEMHHLGDEFFSTQKTIPSEMVQQWQQRIVAIHHAVVDAHVRKRISDNEASEYLQGARELRRELSLATDWPWKREPAKTRRRTKSSDSVKPPNDSVASSRLQT